MHVRCPHCQNALDVVPEVEFDDLTCPSCGSQIDLVGEATATVQLTPRKVAHFELRDQLGRGQFGTVWLAQDTLLDRRVAVKIPRNSSLDGAEVDGFLREARAAAQLRHPHIVSVHEVGLDADSVYIASDFIDGADLKSWLTQKSLGPRAAAELCATIAAALQHAHEAGVIHRDLKPANIIMDGQGQPHLTDFGLAKRESGEATITLDGQILGTPAYMPPEQAQGKSHMADARSDVYSLGVVLYQLLVGRPPFQGDKRMLILQITHDPPPPLKKLNPRVSRDLETICLKCLEKDPAQRYASADELRKDLQRYLNGETVVARRTPSVVRLTRWVRRKPLAASTLALLVLAAALGSAMIRQVLNSQPKRQTVLIPTQPEDAYVVFIPLDSDSGDPQPNQASRARRSSRTARLVPGDYLVVAYLNDDYFHEVYRRVPETVDDLIGVYPHLDWQFDEAGVVTLPPVKLHRAQDVTANMVKLTGSSDFVMGSSQLSVAPAHRRSLPDFFLDLTEVTVGQLRDTGLSLPRAMPDQELDDESPVTNVPYDLAAMYAEQLGKRLMQEAEYEFAATNGATTEYPWGNTDIPEDNWTIGPVGSAAHDQISIGSRTIDGLYSNVSEWTDTWGVGYPSQVGSMPLGRQGRILRGGPIREEAAKGPRYRVIGLRPMRSVRVGFRCMRSVKPRTKEQDFGVVLDD